MYCEIFNFNIDFQTLIKFAPNGLILSGGPASVHNSIYNLKIPEFIFTINIPILGICYGMQAMVHQFGGVVNQANKCEFGCAKIIIQKPSKLFKNLPNIQDVWMSHGDEVVNLSKTFEVIAISDNNSISVIKHLNKPFYGVQYHPEVTHSRYGKELLSNFVLHLCNCKALWNSKNIISNIVSDICTKISSDSVLLGLSGGVDSLVVAALLQKAIGNRLTCVFIDTGLLRLHEGDKVMSDFSKNIEITNLLRINAENRFFKN